MHHLRGAQAAARRLGAGLLALAALGAAGGVQATEAQEPPAGSRILPTAAPARGLPLWELGLGAGVLTLPHYRGSDEQHRWLLPVPYFVYRGTVLRRDREGTRAVLLDGDRLRLDFSADASPPVEAGSNRAREGMGRLAPTVEFGPNLNWRLGRGAGWKVDLRVPLRAALSVERRPQALGFTLSPVLNLDLSLQGWSVGVQGGPTWAGSRFHQHFYGVGAAEQRAWRPAYEARGGFSGWGATVAASRRVGDWWLAAYARHESLDGAVFRDSPLVRQRSNLSAGLALSYIFKVSDERVAAQP